MHIAYVLDTYPSLTETFLAREIHELRRREVQVTVLALHAGEGAHPIPLSPWQRLSSKVGRSLNHEADSSHWRTVGAQFQLSPQGRAVLRGVQHIHGGFASHPGLIAWGIAQAGGLTWSFSGHARDVFVDGDDFPSMIASATFATSCTQAGRQFLAAQAPDLASKVLYVPHGLAVESFPFHGPDRRPRHRNGEVPQLLSVGRLVEKKGFMVLLDALAILRERGVGFRATVVGEGPQRAELERRRGLLGLGEQVALTGARSHEQVKELMHHADAFVLACREAVDGDRDGLPNVLLEAAACGCPVVSTCCGGVTDFLTEATGWLCDPDDSPGLAAAIQRVLESPDEAAARARRARQTVETDFDIQANIQRLLAAFAQATKA